MPRAPKPTSSQHRTTPYPVTTPTTLAPSTMASHHTSPQDRHAAQTWTPENDELLMRARQQGLNWQPIASKYFPDKTSNACRKRHERLMEKRNNADNWDGVKMDKLSKAYLELREQMWKILADRVGEKWQSVEAKVYHPTNEPKTITSAANMSSSAWRKVSRLSRLQVAQPHGAKQTITVTSTPTRSAPDHIKTKKTALTTAALAPTTIHSAIATPSDREETTSSKHLTLLVASPIIRLHTAPTIHSATLPLHCQDIHPQRRPHPNFLLFLSNRRPFRASVLPLACQACQVSQLFYITHRTIHRLLRRTSTVTTWTLCSEFFYQGYLFRLLTFLHFLPFLQSYSRGACDDMKRTIFLRSCTIRDVGV